VVVGVDEAVLVEVLVWVVLAGRVLEVAGCDDCCCWVVEDDVEEVVSGVDDCGVVADAEGELELLIFATVTTMVMMNEARKMEGTYRIRWNC
jgi:hypothetical protein